ncbi:MAG: alkane 1-monooxygenase [Alphaproteobacteria bacterium]|nr:alkane 1-monooxygenase [Alphaproteobacteria bacterium]
MTILAQTQLRFAGPFVFLASVPLLYRLSSFAPSALVPALLLSLLIAHEIPYSDVGAGEVAAERLLPALYIPLQLMAILWALFEVAFQDASTFGFVGLAAATGVCTGVFGALAAHEMVHSRGAWQRWLGALMLTGMSYRHFRLAHIYGHHRFVATLRDPSTARYGESFYAFLWRTLVWQVVYAWRFEQHRARNAAVSIVRNRVFQDIAITALLYIAVYVFCAARAMAFLAAESAVAIIVLELFNYVAHYGMLRGPREPMGDQFSWNCSGAANLLLFNMGRHSHHHRAPAMPYEGLRLTAAAPELPGGYAGAIMLALIPPLWRRVMHRRLANISTLSGDCACNMDVRRVAAVS